MVWPPLLIDLAFPEAAALRWMAPFVVKPQNRPVISPDLRSETLRIAYALGALGDSADPRGRDVAPCVKPAAVVEGGSRVDCERNRLLTRMLLLQLLTFVLTDPANQHLRNCAIPIASQHLSPALMLVFSTQEHVSVKDAAAACGMARDILRGKPAACHGPSSQVHRFGMGFFRRKPLLPVV